MHVTIDELRELADFYRKEKLLDDKQLAVKKHMADCDMCYSIFCAEYLLQKELTENSLIPEISYIQNEEGTADIKKEKFFIQITKKKDGIKIAAHPDFTQNMLWNFFLLPQTFAARSVQSLNISEKTAGEDAVVEQYNNINSKYTHITYDGIKTVIQLDGDIYPIENLQLKILDGAKTEQYDFQYNKETECWQAVVEHHLYSDKLVIEVTEKKDERE